jgi:hypothetical protein
MNERHLQLCASAEWAETVQNDILPWALGTRELGDDVLKSPRPGQTTDVLRENATAHRREVDQLLPARSPTGCRAQTWTWCTPMAPRYRSTTHAFPPPRRSPCSTTCRLPRTRSPAAELRVLRSGGVLIGADSIESPEWWELHVGDTCVPVNPDTQAERLTRAGFVDVEVQRSSPEPSRRFRFAARAP